jgi:hypothetical protein
MMKAAYTAALLLIVIGANAAMAQNPPSSAPALQSAAPAPAGANDKSAISKACSDQANAKGLKGKERKKFRSECKKNGGKPS